MNTSLPDTITTTKGFDLFYSIEWLGTTCYFFDCDHSDADDCDQCEMDNLYRILSADPISDSTILSLLGKNASSKSDLNDLGIHWIQREIWKHAAPIYQDDGRFLNDVEIPPAF